MNEHSENSRAETSATRSIAMSSDADGAVALDAHLARWQTAGAIATKSRAVHPNDAAEYFEVLMKMCEAEAQRLPPETGPGVVHEFKAIHLQMLLGRVQDAIMRLVQLIPAAQSPAVYLLLAEAHLRNNDAHGAFDTLNLMEQVHPGLAETNLLHAIILITLCQADKARGMLREAVRRKPDLILAWRILIRLELAEDNRMEAVQLLHEALKHNPNDQRVAELQHGLDHSSA